MTFYLGLGPELYPRSTRRQQRTAPISDYRGGRPCLDLTIFCAKMQTFIGSEKKENGENGGSFLTTQNHLFFDCQWGFLSMALLTRLEVKLKLN